MISILAGIAKHRRSLRRAINGDVYNTLMTGGIEARRLTEMRRIWRRQRVCITINLDAEVTTRPRRYL